MSASYYFLIEVKQLIECSINSCYNNVVEYSGEYFNFSTMDVSVVSDRVHREFGGFPLRPVDKKK